MEAQVINSNISLIYSYLSIVNISLFAFNLVPLSYLDGCEILDASLDLALRVRPNVGAEDSDPEGMSSRSGQWRKLWKDRLRRIVTISSNSMMLVVIVLTLAREIA
jgi:membrane-associated protease RseP (regulator of RpoE activity)